MNKAKIIKEKVVLSDYFIIEEATIEHEMDNGVKSRYTRKKLDRPDAVTVFLYNKTRDIIILVKQYRYPIKSDSLELPAGHILPDETPENCAKRELKEETGYSAGKIEKIFEYHPSTEYSDQVYHIFIAEDLKEGKTNREKYELIDVELLDFKSVIEKITDGTIKDGRTITAVLLGKSMGKL